MAESLETLAIFLSMVLAMFGVLMPFAWMLRLLPLSLLALAAYHLLDNPVPAWAAGMFDGVVESMIVLFWWVIALIALARFLFAAKQGALEADVINHAGDRIRKDLDALVAIAAGCILSLAVVIELAWALSGTAALDSSLAIAAGVVSIGMGFLLRRWRSPIALFLLATCLSFAVLAGLGATQPDRILRQAASYADGNPFCLFPPPDAAPITSRDQLTLFSMAKTTLGRERHLTLLIQAEDGLFGHYWSIRNQRFSRGGSRAGRLDEADLPCTPVRAFLAD